MSRRVALLLVLAFLIALCVSVVMPAESAADATENSWESKAPVPISILGVAAVNGKVYAFASNQTYEYNPITDTWTMKKPQPFSIHGAALAVYQNKVYTIGQGNGRTQVYDPATDTWENKTSMPTPRTQLEANVVNGKIYLIGGRTGGQYSTVGLNEVYDPETDSWTTKAPIPYPVVQYASAVVDNKIYIIGGQDEFTYPMNLALVQIYDSETDTWSFGTPMPKVVWQAAAGVTSGVWAPKRIYVIGGLPEKDLFGTDLNQVYNPENGSWTVGESMPTARFTLHVAVVNDKLYAMGGLPYFNLEGIGSRENEQYTPIGYKAIPQQSPPPEPHSDSFLTTLVTTASVATIAIIGVGLLVYFKKRKH